MSQGFFVVALVKLHYTTRVGYRNTNMAHTQNRQDRMLNRVRRIRGQVEAIERALEENRGCGEVLCLIAASRGAMNSLMAEVVEQHVHENVLEAPNDRLRLNAAEELVEVVSTYLR